VSWLLHARIQKLFLVAILLKIGLSALSMLGSGWFFKWGFALILPLTVMAAYIALGVKRRDRDVTDEKFADSCYYLGFIFTITSIIFALFDLPNIGTRIEEIAVRFGAAMLSTVFGLVVRVYLVSFKADVSDAIRGAEDELIYAIQRFREQLTMSVEKLSDFQGQVDKASGETVERVKMQVEKMGQDHAERLSAFFSDLTQKNQQAFSQALDEVSTSSRRLSTSVDAYTKGMNDNLASIEQKVTFFAVAVSERLQSTTFPDDYFARQLKGPLEQISGAVDEVVGVIEEATSDLGEASKTLATALKRMTTKATSNEEALETIARLTVQHQAILDAASGQLDSLKSLSESLGTTKASVLSAVAALGVTKEAISEIAEKIETSFTETAGLRVVVSEVIDEVKQAAQAGVAALSDFSQTTKRTGEFNERLGSQLEASTRATSEAVVALRSGIGEVVARFDALAASGANSTESIVALREQTISAIERVSHSAEQLGAIGDRLSEVSRTVQAHAEATSALARAAVSDSVSPHPPTAASSASGAPAF
jgi:chromosome segregation ATPase